MAGSVGLPVGQSAATDTVRVTDAHLRALFHDSPVAIGVARDGVTIGANPAYLRLFGYESEDELIGQSIFDQAAPHVRSGIVSRFQARKAGERAPSVYETVALRKDGSEFPCVVTVTHGDLPDGQLIVIFCIDVTNQRRAEREIKDALAFNQVIVDMAPIGILLYEASGQCILANNAAAATSGATVEQLCAQNFRRLDSWKKDGLLRAADEALKSGSVVSEEFHSVSTFGAEAWFRGQFAPLTIHDEKHLLFLFENIMERKRAEEQSQSLRTQLLRAQKMEAVGQLAGGVAHDFNNMLAAITLQTNFLQMRGGRMSPEETREATDDLLALVNRAAGLTRQLLLFSRRQPMANAKCDLNAIVTDLTKLLARVLGVHIDLVVNCSNGPLWFEGDGGMIEQVVMNLCVNARDAMPSGGRLELQTDQITLGEDFAVEHRAGRPGRFARLRVVDAGQGMEPAVLEHLFEPFFTTKEVGKGTGLGLATAHGIVTKHGGWVEVQTEAGKGSTFTVCLPCAAPAGDVVAATRGRAAPGAGERILLVEDESVVRRMAARCLREFGYSVVEAESADDALRVWEREQGRFDLLLTDMVMPGGLSGLDLCRRLRQERPGLRTVITSGYSLDLVQDDGALMEDITYLGKPFEVHTLAAAVRACLGKKG